MSLGYIEDGDLVCGYHSLKPEEADESLIPFLQWHENPEWAYAGGKLARRVLKQMIKEED